MCSSDLGVNIKMMASPDQDHKRPKRDHGQNSIVTAKHAPGRAGVAPMHQFEEPRQDDLFLRISQIMEHEQLGQLVEQEDEQG